MNEERYATRRTSYLARTTELRRPEANAVAWSELGYTHAGITKRIDSSEGTVKQYLERAMARYGVEISHAVMPDTEPPDYEIVGPDYLDELSREVKKQWLRLVDQHRNSLPQEWVAKVEEAAEEEHDLPFRRL